jgi:hypothetical protein
MKLIQFQGNLSWLLNKVFDPLTQFLLPDILCFMLCQLNFLFMIRSGILQSSIIWLSTCAFEYWYFLQKQLSFNPKIVRFNCMNLYHSAQLINQLCCQRRKVPRHTPEWTKDMLYIYIFPIKIRSLEKQNKI